MNEDWNRRAWLVVLFGFVALAGVTIQARGALIPSFQESFDVSESQLGLVTSVGTVGFVISMLSVGFAAGRLDMKRYMLFSVLFTAVGLAVISLAPTFLLLLVLVGLRSVATGVFRALDRPVLSHLFSESRGRIFSLHSMAWAVGATSGPILVTLVLMRFDWSVTYLIIAAAFVPLLVAIWFLDLPESTANERSISVSDIRMLVKQPPIYGMGLALVIVGGIESAFFTWLPYYATQLFSETIAGLTLSVYLAAYIPGRYVFSHLTERYEYTNIVLVVGALLTVVLYATFVLADGYVLLALIFVTGLLVSGLFPTLITLGIDSNPSYTGPVNAVGYIFQQAGFFSAPAIIGVLADSYSIQEAMLLQIGFAAALTILVLALKRGPLGTPSETRASA